ncbi:hypothetical protein [Cellvibrio sp. QJXJ]|uniref:hypothetical protein n=1 Tax=Cellvibrio sp. QJXJ TaxID=2964606 RepID=UPI0021C37CA9|nr:hypothetical protein [Cellvibrio sp. QJXJ]UUA75149.1 hypothetical protein NNX04_22085 [Cellvibrio sp. QJXJ]
MNPTLIRWEIKVGLKLFKLYSSFNNGFSTPVQICYVFFNEQAREKLYQEQVMKGTYINIKMEEQVLSSPFEKDNFTLTYVRYNTEGAVELGRMKDTYVGHGGEYPYYTTPELYEEAKVRFEELKARRIAEGDRFYSTHIWV